MPGRQDLLPELPHGDLVVVDRSGAPPGGVPRATRHRRRDHERRDVLRDREGIEHTAGRRRRPCPAADQPPGHQPQPRSGAVPEELPPADRAPERQTGIWSVVRCASQREPPRGSPFQCCRSYECSRPKLPRAQVVPQVGPRGRAPVESSRERRSSLDLLAPASPAGPCRTDPTRHRQGDVRGPGLTAALTIRAARTDAGPTRAAGTDEGAEAVRRENPPGAGGFKCAREDLNLHGPYGPQGPQPCASTNSATGAWSGDYSGRPSAPWIPSGAL